ncbi:MAG: heavy-metal-associated domain-containing protein [Bacteroidota bacterium]
MKTLVFFITLLIPMLGVSNQDKTEFKVYGACEMCKARIEKAAKSVHGVHAADWDMKTQMLTLDYDTQKVDLDDVHQKIADAGHDTEKVRASDETYQSLPACCKYKRPKEE